MDACMVRYTPKANRTRPPAAFSIRSHRKRSMAESSCAKRMGGAFPAPPPYPRLRRGYQRNFFFSIPSARSTTVPIQDQAPAVAVVPERPVLSLHQGLELRRGEAQFPGDILQVRLDLPFVVARLLQRRQRLVPSHGARQDLVGEVAFAFVVPKFVGQIVALVKAGEYIFVVLVVVGLPAEPLLQKTLGLLFVIVQHIQGGHPAHALEQGVVEPEFQEAAGGKGFQGTGAEAAVYVPDQAQIVLVHPLHRGTYTFRGAVGSGENVADAPAHRLVV